MPVAAAPPDSGSMKAILTSADAGPARHPTANTAPATLRALPTMAPPRIVWTRAPEQAGPGDAPKRMLTIRSTRYKHRTADAAVQQAPEKPTRTGGRPCKV